MNSMIISLQKRPEVKRYAIALIIVLHLAGFVGMNIMEPEVFAGLTPFNLLLSAALIILGHNGSARSILTLFLITFFLGYAVELLGTQTGFPFGNYSYGSNLGPKLIGVPVIIGVNWFLMVMGSGFLLKVLSKNFLIQVIGAALIMMLVDLAIEPVAPVLDFWSWADGEAPLLNYIGWFFTALIMQFAFFKLIEQSRNILALTYFIAVTAFFILLNIALL